MLRMSKKLTTFAGVFYIVKKLFDLWQVYM